MYKLVSVVILIISYIFVSVNRNKVSKLVNILEIYSVLFFFFFLFVNVPIFVVSSSSLEASGVLL